MQEGANLQASRFRLPGSSQPEEVVAVVAPVGVVDEHAPVTDVQSDAVRVGERFGTAAPAASEEVFAGLREVDEQGRGGDGDGRGLPEEVDSRQVLELLFPILPVG